MLWRWVISAIADSAERKILTRERASSSSLSANQESIGIAKEELVRAVSSQALRRVAVSREEKEDREELEDMMVQVLLSEESRDFETGFIGLEDLLGVLEFLFWEP